MNGAATALAKSPAEVICDLWQARALARSKGKTAAVVLAVLFFNYGEAMQVLLRVVYPGFRDLKFPYYASGATIVKSGQVVCDLATDRVANFILTTRNALVYDSEAELIKEFRDLADRLKLNDNDRVAMTTAVQNWVVADHRINHLGQKAAS